MKTTTTFTDNAIDNPNTDPIRLVEIELGTLTLYLSDRVWGTGADTCVYDSQLYEPLVLSWGTIQHGRVNPVTYETAVSQVAITLNNDLGVGGYDHVTELFDALGFQYSKVTIYEIYNGATAAGDAVGLFIGQCEDFIGVQDNQVTLRASGYELDVANKFSHTIVDDTTYANADPDALGKMLPEVWGTVKRVPAVKLDVRAISSTQEWYDDDDTSITLTDASDFPATCVVTWDSEICEVTAKSGNILTVTRGFANSTAANHTPGATVMEWRGFSDFCFAGHGVKAITNGYRTSTEVAGKEIVVDSEIGYAVSRVYASGGENSNKAMVVFDSKIYIGGVRYIHSSTDGFNWTEELDVGQQASIEEFGLFGSNIYAAIRDFDSDDSWIYESSDGSTWTNVKTFTGAAWGGDWYFSPFAEMGGKLYIIVAITIDTHYELWETADGSTWALTKDFAADEYQGLATVNSLLISCDVTAPGNSFIKKSADGVTWNNSLDLGAATQYMRNAHLMGSTLFIEYAGSLTSGNGDIESTTDATTWTSRTRPLGGMPPHGFASDSTYLYAATWSGRAGADDSGLFRSDDSGDTWSEMVKDGFSSYIDSTVTKCATMCPTTFLDALFVQCYGATDEDSLFSLAYPLLYTGQSGDEHPTLTGLGIVSIWGYKDVGNVWVDCDGYQDDGAGTYTGTPDALIERPDHVCKHIIIAKCGLAAAQIDSTSYTASGTSYNSNSYAMGVVLLTRPDVRSLLNRIAVQARSMEFWEYGTHHLKYLDDTDTPDRILEGNRIDQGQLWVRYTPRVELQNTWTARYARDWSGRSDTRDADRAVVTATDAASVTKYGTLQGAQLGLVYIGTDESAQAQDIIDWFKDENSNPRVVVEFAGGDYLTPLVRGDVVQFRVSSGGYLDSALAGFGGAVVWEDREDGDGYLWQDQPDDSVQWVGLLGSTKYRVMDMARRPDTGIQLETIEVVAI